MFSCFLLRKLFLSGNTLLEISVAHGITNAGGNPCPAIVWHGNGPAGATARVRGGFSTPRGGAFRRPLLRNSAPSTWSCSRMRSGVADEPFLRWASDCATASGGGCYLSVLTFRAPCRWVFGSTTVSEPQCYQLLRQPRPHRNADWFQIRLVLGTGPPGPVLWLRDPTVGAIRACKPGPTRLRLPGLR